jgi:ABC-2 type transport system ATP-binding protein
LSLLEARNLSRSYGEVRAVDDLSVSLEPGTMLALLGPNGAGKTTTIDLLSGGSRPDAGDLFWQGRPVGPVELRRNVGLCPQELQLWPRLRCSEQLVMVGRLYGLTSVAAVRRADVLLEELGLAGKAGARADTLSGGMKRRLNLALALVSDPPVLVLDEPEAGLDPQSRVLVRELIARLATDHAVLLTSHDIAEVELLADQVTIIDHGRVIATGSPGELVAALDLGDAVELRPAGDPASLAEAVAAETGAEVGLDAGTVSVRLRRGGVRLPVLLAALEAGGFAVESLQSRPATLEDVFLQLTGRSLRE